MKTRKTAQFSNSHAAWLFMRECEARGIEAGYPNLRTHEVTYLADDDQRQDREAMLTALRALAGVALVADTMLDVDAQLRIHRFSNGRSIADYVSDAMDELTDRLEGEDITSAVVSARYDR